MRTLSLPRHQRFAIGQRASGGQCGPTRRVASAGPRGVARKPKSAFRTPVVAFLDQRPEGQEANVAGLTRVHFVCMQKASALTARNVGNERNDIAAIRRGTWRSLWRFLRRRLGSRKRLPIPTR